MVGGHGFERQIYANFMDFESFAMKPLTYDYKVRLMKLKQ